MYCLVYGQMSHWGSLLTNIIKYIVCASNILFIFSIYFSKSKSEIVEPYYNNEGNYVCTNRKYVTNFNDELNDEIITIIYGTLLGNSHAEKKYEGGGTRISFNLESTHEKYLLYLHKRIANLGYCNTNIPEIQTRLGKNGKIRKIIRFYTWSYNTLNNIKEEWYNEKKIKKVPKSISKYFNPLLIALWIMNDGVKVQNGLKLNTKNLNYSDLELLQSLFLNKYDIVTIIQSTGVENQYILYVDSYSMNKLRELVKSYILSSMKYKLNM